MVTVVGLQAALAEMQEVEGLLVAEGEGREEPVATEVVEEEWETAVGSAVVMEEEERVEVMEEVMVEGVLVGAMVEEEMAAEETEGKAKGEPAWGWVMLMLGMLGGRAWRAAA